MLDGLAQWPAERISRRAFLRSAAVGASGLIGAYLLGCGGGGGAEPTPTATNVPFDEIVPTPPVTAMRWQPLSVAGALPPARRDHSLVADGERLVLFGGRGPNPLGDTWVYAIASNLWEQTIGDPAPRARFGHNAVWDLASNRIVLFGGQGEGGTFFNDLWAFDPETWQWSQLDTGSGPSPRYGAGSAYDPTGRLLITHGFTDSGRFDDTWQLDLASQTWSDVSPDDDRPIERCLMRAVWDPRQERLFMFGGQTTDTPFLGDLWSYALGGWRELARDPQPSPRNFYAMVFDEEAFHIILFGGNTSGGPVNDVWFFDAGSERWGQLPQQDEGPSARYGHDGVWLPERRSLAIFGGNDGGEDLNDLWELTATS